MLVGETLGDGVDRGLHPRMGRGQEADDRQHQVRRVELGSPEVLGERAGFLAPALVQDTLVDLVTRGFPGVDAVLGVDEARQRDGPVERHPAHDLGVEEMARLAADLPDALVGLAPLDRGRIRAGRQKRLGVVVEFTDLLGEPP